MTSAMSLVYIWLKFKILNWPNVTLSKPSQRWSTSGRKKLIFMVQKILIGFGLYYSNGNPLLFEGDLQNEQSVLEWLIDDDNRELADEIEEVNERMLDRLMAESTLLVVFFCK